MIATFVKVKGYCPMGCGATLYLDNDGAVVCNEHECPDDAAAAKILADNQPEHVVFLGSVDFTIRHPLRERIDDELLSCDLHSWLQEHDPETFGTCLAVRDEHGQWSLNPREVDL